jgi:hypothetical protein
MFVYILVRISYAMAVYALCLWAALHIKPQYEFIHQKTLIHTHLEESGTFYHTSKNIDSHFYLT